MPSRLPDTNWDRKSDSVAFMRDSLIFFFFEEQWGLQQRLSLSRRVAVRARVVELYGGDLVEGPHELSILSC